MKTKRLFIIPLLALLMSSCANNEIHFNSEPASSNIATTSSQTISSSEEIASSITSSSETSFSSDVSSSQASSSSQKSEASSSRLHLVPLDHPARLDLQTLLNRPVLRDLLVRHNHQALLNHPVLAVRHKRIQLLT